MKPLVLVVDDKPNLLSLMVKVLGADAEVVTARCVQEALAALRSRAPDAVVCDLRMPDGDGLAVLRALRATESPAPFILMTAYGTVPTAVQAMREGAWDYVTKPFDPDDLRALVLRALREARVLQNNTAPAPEALAAPAPAPAERDRLGRLLGRSPAMQGLYRMIERVAPTDATVLVLGETGTGKELVARELHERSPRAGRSLVAVNCAAIPASLIESELFGYVRGAFTGASADRAGLFEEAHGSSLLLDEVGELRFPLQARLTRALEERAVRRVGDPRERKVDVRLIAATHRDLPALVRDGAFRQDLWYRLNVCVLTVPPLRERREDVPLLAHHFLASLGPRGPSGFAPGALAALAEHDWPGNVRELRSAVERAAILEEGDRITAASLPPELRGLAPAEGPRPLAEMTYREAVDVAREAATRRYLEAVLARHRGNVTAAAALAGVERESFHRLLRRHGLRADAWREEPSPGPRAEPPAPPEEDGER
ncbi:MAG: sigma-54-dependent Fis family transcriptional regulator [Deltaproteobacteria bacterium]|nr:sigma-54-dependent Fis family transcriptional regulator [Deltaproteobacteria bacterium]